MRKFELFVISLKSSSRLFAVSFLESFRPEISLFSTINSTGVFGAFVYGFAERMLLPFGLHHFIYLPFFFTSLGGVMEIGGQTVEGAVNIYNAILNTPGAMFDINISRYVMNGKVLFAMFGLTGAALAIYKTAKKENRKKVASLMIAAVIPCALMGITEPLVQIFMYPW